MHQRILQNYKKIIVIKKQPCAGPIDWECFFVPVLSINCTLLDGKFSIFKNSIENILFQKVLFILCFVKYSSNLYLDVVNIDNKNIIYLFTAI